METADDACRTGKAMLGALMERKAQRGTNRACSGMIATVALPHTVQGLRRWSEHLGGDGDWWSDQFGVVQLFSFVMRANVLSSLRLFSLGKSQG